MRRPLLGFMLAGIWLGQSACQTGDRSLPAHGWTVGSAPLLASAKGNAPSPATHPGVRFHTKPKPLPPGAVTHDWTSFLGPSHNGVSTETRLLKDWPEGGPPLVWELAKGTGYTSPAIHGSRLVYFYRQGQEEIVDCLHPETGQRYWTFRYPTGYSDRYGYNNGPRCSPVIDGNRVYIYGAEGQLHSLDLKSGAVHWKRHLSREFRVPQDFFGVASTPLVEGNQLIVNVGAPGGPSVIALDKATGKLVWEAGDRWGPSYASPVPATVRDKRRIFVFAGGESRPPTGGLLSIDPANGKIDFRFPWRSRSYESVNASNPVVIGNQVLISASYKTGAALLDLLPDSTHRIGLDRTPLRPALGTRPYTGRVTSTGSTAAMSPMRPWCASI